MDIVRRKFTRVVPSKTSPDGVELRTYHFETDSDMVMIGNTQETLTQRLGNIETGSSFELTLEGDVSGTGEWQRGKNLVISVVVQDDSHGHTGKTVTIEGEESNNKIVVTTAEKTLGVSDVTATELGYLKGVTENVQEQLDDKVDSSTIGQASGIAPLDESGKVPKDNIPFDELSVEAGEENGHISINGEDVTVYTHPDLEHLPEGGSENQIIRWVEAGTGSWGDETSLSLNDEVEGEGNALTEIKVEGHSITLVKNTTFLTEHQNVSVKYDQENKKFTLTVGESESDIVETNKLMEDMSPVQGPTEEADGKKGLVPEPKMGDEEKFLRGDGTWTEIKVDTSFADHIQYSETQPENQDEGDLWLQPVAGPDLSDEDMDPWWPGTGPYPGTGGNTGVIDPDLPKELQSITITTPPLKTLYDYNERFNPAGMVVQAHYLNGATFDNVDFTYDNTGLSKGTEAVKITYTEGDINAVAWQPIKVRSVTHITIAQPPIKTAYIVDETFDRTGMIVTVHYDDGSTKDILGSECGYSPSKMARDTTEVQMSYYAGYTYYYATQPVTSRAIKVPKPYADVTTFDFNGYSQGPEWINYDPDIMTMYGTTGKGSFPGNSDTRFKLKNDKEYMWEDGTIADITINWSILKAAPKLKCIPEIPTITSPYKTCTFVVGSNLNPEFSYNGNTAAGVVSAVSSDTSVATVTTSQNTVVVTAGEYVNGTATIYITRAADSYTLESSTTCEVVVNTFPMKPSLEDYTWEEVAQIANHGLANEYFDIGDMKSVRLNGIVGTLAVNQNWYCYIIGIDHNEVYEGTGIHFGTFKDEDGKNYCLCDSYCYKRAYDYNNKKYLETDGVSGENYFTINRHSTEAYGGWSACDMRYDILGSTNIMPQNFKAEKIDGNIGYDATPTTSTNPIVNSLMGCFPADLRAVMTPMTKYTDNTGYTTNTGKDNTNSTWVTKTVDYLPLLAEYEVFGEREFANIGEQQYQAQYEYYANSSQDVRIKYSNLTGATAFRWFLRSPAYSRGDSPVGEFGIVHTDGSATYYWQIDSNGISPIFKVGGYAPGLPHRKSLEATSWDEISRIADAGLGELYWEVGDTKSVYLNGTVGTLGIDTTLYCYIIGFNHNEEYEGTGIHFGTWKVVGGTDVALCDSNYGTQKTGLLKLFNMNHFDQSSYGGWAGCDLRYDVLGSTNIAPKGYGATATADRVGYDPAEYDIIADPVENTLMSALPSDLRAAMRPMAKYTDNVGGTSTAADNVTKTLDYLPLLSYYEVSASTSNGNSAEATYQKQYAYFNSTYPKSAVKYKIDSPKYDVNWWLRSPRSGTNGYFGYMYGTSGVSYAYSNYSYALSPIFKVGGKLPPEASDPGDDPNIPDYIDPNPNSIEYKTWAEISKIADEGLGEEYWDIGDMKSIQLKGYIGRTEINKTLWCYIIGFDHNKDIEGIGITFGTFKDKNGTDICLVDAKYNSSSSDGTSWFSMNHSQYSNCGGWAACDLRYDILGSTDKQPDEYNVTKKSSSKGYDASKTTATNPVPYTLMSCLPEDLREVMSPITKYTDNVGNKTQTSACISATIDYLPLLAEDEVFGTRTNANSYERNNLIRYPYYVYSDKRKYRYDNSATAAEYHLRSPCYINNAGFVIVTTSGTSSFTNGNYSYGLAPIFKVGGKPRMAPPEFQLENMSWAEISKIADEGLGEEYWDIGDMKSIELNGTIGTSFGINTTLYCYIIGFNHNEKYEGTGIHFGTFKGADGTDLCLIDSVRTSNNYVSGTKCFNIAHWWTSTSPNVYTYGGWAGSDLRYDILGSTNVSPSDYGKQKTASNVGYNPTNYDIVNSPLADTVLAALPRELRAVMKPMTKYTDNVGYASSDPTHVTTTIDYLPLLSQIEVFNDATNINPIEATYQKQYDYYSAGRSKIKYSCGSVGTVGDATYWWTRSQLASSNYRYSCVNNTGQRDAMNAYSSYGIAPIFKVGGHGPGGTHFGENPDFG